MAQRKETYILVGNLEGKKPLGRYCCIWEDNIKINLKEIGCEGSFMEPKGSSPCSQKPMLGPYHKSQSTPFHSVSKIRFNIILPW